MADITMCVNTICPNAKHCYRVQAIITHGWQIMDFFEYTIGVDGVICDNYLPVYDINIETKSDIN
jgi:hypothetical protein